MRWLILGLFAVVACYWAWKIRYNGAPDEEMRYLLPIFIYQHGHLPLGTDPGAMYSLGNWSYAYYPQWLGPILSATMMKIASLISTAPHVLLFAARSISVIAGGVTLLFINQIILKLTDSWLIANLLMCLVGFLPQYTYLSSYVNNDILAVCGVSVIAWALITKSWRPSTVVILGIGIAICALSYLNASGYILCAGLWFVGSLIQQVHANVLTKSYAWRLFVLLVLICAVLVLPFYIRNLLVYRDLLGMQAFHQAYAQWLHQGGQVLQKPYSGGIWQLVFDREFYHRLAMSSVGRFSYLTVNMTWHMYQVFYALYGAILLLSGCGGLKAVFKHDTRSKQNPWGMLAIIGGALITIGLYGYYCVHIDYQYQARYLATLIIPISVFVGLGSWRLLHAHPRLMMVFSVGVALVVVALNGLVYHWYITMI